MSPEDPPPAPIHQPALSDVISDKVRKDLLENVYEPGDVIRIRTLAERFGVSTMPVREALRRLEAEGLVQFDKNRRIQVRALSPDEAQELFDIREALEPLAMLRGAVRLRDDAEAIARLRDLIEQMDRDVSSDDWRNLNAEFHRTLYAAADMPRLAAIISSLWAGTDPYIRRYSRTTPIAARAQEQHREMVEAILAGDPERAAEVLRTQINYSRRVVTQDVFERNGATAPSSDGAS